MKKFLFCLISILCLVALVYGQQPFKFAQVTDTHVGGSTGAEDLRRTVRDLNQQSDIDFVILSGDVTEFGSDEELALAKQILDSLSLPLYVLPGNHDSNWSESGANSFRKVFGDETFFFRHKGYLFMGTTSGPNMRMSPGQIPRENLVWMDSVFRANPDKETPLIFINHYPLDSSLNNWYEAVDRLKQRNVQLAMCGHGHNNSVYNWEGIPGVMGRSNLRAKDSVGGYNIISVENGAATYTVRRPLWKTEASWTNIPLKNHQFNQATAVYKRPDFSVNGTYASQVQEVWRFQDDADLGAGMASYRNLLITGNTAGQVFALDVNTGKKVWTYQTGGKVYATPAVWKNTVIVGSSDGTIYGLHADTGQLQWQIKTDKAVLGSAVIEKGIAFVGGSDRIFRAIDVKRGKIKWTFDRLQGYVSGKPTLYKDKVIFGDWGNGFYALSKKTGQLQWSWDNGHKNRMLSAAACYPVATNNRIFIVTPDRYMTCLDAVTGEVIWREKKDTIRVRESMGLSDDGCYVYVKTMDGNLLGISTTADSMDIAWRSTLQLPYELAPSAIATNGKQVFVPSHSGLLSGVDVKNGEVLWQYKLSNAMINPIFVLRSNHVIISTMDGVMMKLYLDKE
ncbi:outer membrane protein assembly factor BamB family protein [Sphingobacterium haloxyli]|uniref:Metallophosphoesterase n=1 Tax=Sphingobacterium haloxyli TaxID=2100533 RepID=A0A2S9IZX9_9SPHI|nr:PQQ-binding-like beta-propeller repeat protein [Sphingobacterium haloxyli]PRD46054.1 metallophosphoesterase [Sphingobacterium haloxyli]